MADKVKRKRLQLSDLPPPESDKMQLKRALRDRGVRTGVREAPVSYEEADTDEPTDKPTSLWLDSSTGTPIVTDLEPEEKRRGSWWEVGAGGRDLALKLKDELDKDKITRNTVRQAMRKKKRNMAPREDT